MIRTRSVAILSFLFTALFFIEYTPLSGRVHIPFDLEGFHYSLADYAYQAIHTGRFPQWDPTIYGGMTFVGNPQAALFYPPTWLMLAANWGRSRLSYQSLEDLALGHVWVAFFLCYIWLRHQKRLHPLACVLGGGVFAFSGYMLTQLQHFGMNAGYAWMPLGFWGVDQADERQSWRPLWKLAVASAMCFLAGYPIQWVVFSICMLAYAMGRRRGARGALMVACALAASLFVSAAQLLPAWEASRWKAPDAKYGSNSGVRDPEFFVSYVIPNYFNFGLNVPIETNPGEDYLYLGAAAIAGLVLLVGRKSFAGAGPPIAALFVCLVFAINPFEIVGRIIERVDLLTQIFGAWYFLAGVTASLALLAALGLDYGLRRTNWRTPAWLAAAAIALSLAWSIRLFGAWHWGASTFSISWMSGIDALAGAMMLSLLVPSFAGSSGRLRAGVAAAALILVAADYKTFGTSKRFNAWRGRLVAATQPLPGMNTSVYETLRQHPEFRSALDLTGPFPLELRHSALTTPQGFDPLLPDQYRILADRVGHFDTNRLFYLNPEDVDTLRLLGAGYFITSEGGPLYARLFSSKHLRLMQPNDSYYKVFELIDPSPAFGWEVSDSRNTVGAEGVADGKTDIRRELGIGRPLPAHRAVLPRLESDRRRRRNHDRALPRSLSVHLRSARDSCRRIPLPIPLPGSGRSDQSLFVAGSGSLDLQRRRAFAENIHG